MSRLENVPSRIEVARMTAALVDLFCRSFPAPPAAITLDIDDTCDAVHGHQQLSLLNAHYDTRCFLPVHVYHVESAKPVAVLLRTGRTPSGPEVRTLVKHLVRRIRRYWPHTRIVFRGYSHYGRAEAMAWCEENGIDHIFGLAGNRALHVLAYEVPDDLKNRRAEAGADRMRSFAVFDYAAGSLGRESRVIARLEASTRGFDARYVVTSLKGEPRHLHEDIYCARGQAENLIKMHKGQLASDRTSCQSPLANQLRLVLHSAAYWLMLALRNAIPRAAPLARAEFATLRLRLLKIGARVVEKATRVRVHFASACPDAALFRLLAGGDVPRKPRLVQPSTQQRPSSDSGAEPRHVPMRTINRASTAKLSVNRSG